MRDLEEHIPLKSEMESTGVNIIGSQKKLTRLNGYHHTGS